MAVTSRAVESLSPEQSSAMLERMEVGRAVFTIGALPAVVPVTFTMRNGDIVICTGADSRLARYADGQVLAFEVDELDVPTRTGWSVVVSGVARIVTDPAERALLQRVVRPWAPGEHEAFIRLPLTLVTGRRIIDTAMSVLSGVEEPY
jgi:nitroimidazol reductase NimA-like FMN-containing flavoprotein (pyridoxamine 5'-phosphate oxidase superfamily)